MPAQGHWARTHTHSQPLVGGGLLEALPEPQPLHPFTRPASFHHHRPPTASCTASKTLRPPEKKENRKVGFFSLFFFSPFPPTPNPTHGATFWRWGLGKEGLRFWKGFYFWNFHCYIFRKKEKKTGKKKTKNRMKHSNCRCSCSRLPWSISDPSPLPGPRPQAQSSSLCGLST